jgi:hypothetical protein
MRKGISLISGVVFMAIILLAITVIYTSSVPVVEKMRVSSAVNKWKINMGSIDNKIQEVASEGTGSRRSLNIRVDTGELVVNGTDDRISWTYDTTSDVVSPRSLHYVGMIGVGSNLRTAASSSTYSGSPAWLLENERLKVYVSRLGNSTDFASVDTSDLVLAIYNKDIGQWFNNTGMVDIYLDSVASSRTGTGYTYLESSGSYLPYGKATAYIQSDYNVNYYIHFTLESGADFVSIEVGT